MSIIYFNDEIVDRIIETEEIVSFISSSELKNRILWICGDTGIGKTSIIKKALKKYNADSKIIIQVETLPLNQNDCVIQGQFLNIITENVHNVMANYGWSMEEFITYASSTRISKQEIQNVINSEFTKLPHTILSTIASRYLKTGLNDISKIILDTDAESILIKREYLKSVFLKGDCIIFISNFHNIDITSFNELNDIITNTSKNIFLFEYTTENSDISTIINYQSRWSENCISALQKIDMLPINFAISIGGSKLEEQLTEWNDFYNNIIKGNLYKVKAMRLQDSSYSSQDPLEQISKLGFEANIILQIIYLHNGEIYEEQLVHLLKESQINLLNYYFKEFQKLEFFLEKDNSKIKIRHSSVSDYLKTSSNNNVIRAGAIAYSILRTVLNQDLSQQFFLYYTKKNMVLLLIQVYSGYDTEKLIDFLNQFKEIIIDEISIEQIYFLVDQVIDFINSSADKRIILSLIRLCYEVGLYEKAYSVLEAYYFPCMDMYMYKAILLNRIDHHYQCIDYCEEILFADNNTRYQFTIKIIKLLSLRTLNQTKECKKLYLEMLNNKEYKNYLEYGILLRNSELIYSYRKDIPYIKKSICFFNANNSIKNSLYAELTLATEISYAGQEKKAYKILSKIKNDFLETTTEKHIFYNDLSAVDIISKNVTLETLVYLEQALLTSHNSYDTLTILSNKICYYIVARQLCEDIIKLRETINKYMAIEPDKRIHRRIYFNLHQYYKYVVNNETEATNAWAKMSSITGTTDEQLDQLIKLESKSNNSNIPLYVSFITYWHFDIPMIELHY